MKISAARRGGFFAALFRLRVQCIFFPAGEYTYSILAKMKNEGRKRRGSGVHFAAIAPQNGEGGGVPFAVCAHMRRPSSGALPIYTRAYPLFIAVKARPQPIFAARAYEKIRRDTFDKQCRILSKSYRLFVCGYAIIRRKKGNEFPRVSPA